MELIIWVDKRERAPTTEIGGKAVGLAHLASFDLPIPPAFCVTVEAQRLYLASAGYQRRAEELAGRLPHDRSREELEAMAYEAPLPEALRCELERALKRMAELAPMSTFAVRSSAIDEDEAGRSFAGQHDTVLGVPANGVEAAIRVCWASLWSERAVAYRHAHDLPFPCSAMGVVVQELVEAQTSAVSFSFDPVSGTHDQMLITVIHGLCEPIVSGAVTPDIAVLDKDTLELLSYEPGDNRLCLVARPGGGVVYVQDPPIERAADEASLRELATLTLNAERCLGVPVDVEAARDGTGWQLVQMRPALSNTPAVALAGANSLSTQIAAEDALSPTPVMDR